MLPMASIGRASYKVVEMSDESTFEGLASHISTASADQIAGLSGSPKALTVLEYRAFLRMECPGNYEGY